MRLQGESGISESVAEKTCVPHCKHAAQCHSHSKNSRSPIPRTGAITLTHGEGSWGWGESPRSGICKQKQETKHSSTVPHTCPKPLSKCSQPAARRSESSPVSEDPYNRVPTHLPSLPSWLPTGVLFSISPALLAPHRCAFLDHPCSPGSPQICCSGSAQTS